MKEKDIAIYAVTEKGKELGLMLKERLNADLFLPKRLATHNPNCFEFESLKSVVKKHFLDYKNHIFITATGIAVRSIADSITSKFIDPGVVVIDQEGKYCISLLGGHLGGANDLAIKVAKILNAQPIITTATDLKGLPAIDVIAEQKGLVPLNPEAIKLISTAFLEHRPVQIYDPEDLLGFKKDKNTTKLNLIFLKEDSCWDSNIFGIWVHYKRKKPLYGQLVLHPKKLVLGIGCNRGTTKEKILEVIEESFQEADLSVLSIKAIATVDIKKHERGIIELAKELKVPVLFFSKEELKDIKVPNPSNLTQKHIGIKSVCEAAAILGANQGPLILTKKKTKDVTIAVAVAK